MSHTHPAAGRGRRAGGAALLVALTLAALAAIAAPAGAAVYDPQDDHTTPWTRAQALQVGLDPTNTKPLWAGFPQFPLVNRDLWVWDTWPLTNLAGTPIKYKGWHVIFSLTAPRSVGYHDRAAHSRIGFFFSKDAKTWQYGGHLFPDGAAPNPWEWAGSTVHIGGNRVEVYYTAVNPSSRLARATGRIFADADGVFFRGFGKAQHSIIVERGATVGTEQYQTDAENGGSAFRDPWMFRNKADGRYYLVFEGNEPGARGSHTCGSREIGDVPPGHIVPADANLATGNIGLAVATRGDRSSWKALPPLISATCVNDQTERPHLVFKNGRYYLFTISHSFTYAAGLSGPDGVYGWVGKGLRSDYQPLNASGLVLGNPSQAPLLQYSDYVMPNGLVESFIDQPPGPDGQTLFGGTLAPTLRLELEGANTYFVEQLDFGFIPGR